MFDFPCSQPGCPEWFHTDNANAGALVECPRCHHRTCIPTAGSGTSLPRQPTSRRSRSRRATVAVATTALVLVYVVGAVEFWSGISQGYETSGNDRLVIPIAMALPPVDPVQAETPVVRSLPSGTDLLEQGESRGLGVLSVVNGTDRDATVKLILSGNRLYRWVYVKANGTATVDRVSAGAYHVLFSSGKDWDSERLRFALERSFTRFEEEFHFSETRLGDAVEYDQVRITLHGVLHGNAASDPIDEAAFDAAQPARK